MFKAIIDLLNYLVGNKWCTREKQENILAPLPKVREQTQKSLHKCRRV